MNNTTRLELLMQKYLDKSCTQAERAELIELIGRMDGPGKMDHIFRDIWSELHQSKVHSDLTWQEVLQGSGNLKKERRMVSSKLWKWSAAAAAIIGILFFVNNIHKVEESFTVFETTYGETKDLVLGDGTKVSLNANSKLAWNDGWQDSGIRHVDLEGEAFFDVAHVESDGDKIPFEVETSDLTINVLGTAFNAAKRRGRTEVFLERGLVSLSLKGGEIVSNQVENLEEQMEKTNAKGLTNEMAVSMKPGDLVRYSLEESRLTQMTIPDSVEQINWKEGVLSYHDVEFRFLLENLEDIYGKSFKVAGEKLLSARIDFAVPYENWETVTEMMEWMLSVEVTDMGNNMVLINRKEK